MKEITCCFTGHRKIPASEYDALKLKLKDVLIKLIERGVIYFGSGGALGFDTLAAKTVLELKDKYPMIKLILVLPCENQTYNWNIEDIKIYNDIKSRCNKYVYISKNYTKDCMFKRNRHLVDNSGICVCYKTKNSGGTAYTVRYAEEKKLEIINVAFKA